jgi:hypothetical protein
MLRKRLYYVAYPALVPCLLLCGCKRAPSINLLGSFFPAWILCIALGIFLSIGDYFLLVRLSLDKELKPAVIVYPCLAASCTFTLWLIFFS